MIDLNPLVIHRAPCKAPRFASSDEYFSTWYTLKDKVQYIPGSNKMAGDVSYHACFHDLPDGLQTHVYAPLGLDIRNKWTIGESKAGEAVELGLDIPKQGLWLREDVDIRCNILITPFVKKTLKKAHATLVNRLVDLSQLTENIKAEQASISDRASISSYGSETLLSYGSNGHGSVSTGSVPLSSSTSLAPSVTKSPTITSSPGHLHPSQIHPAFRPAPPGYRPYSELHRPQSAYANTSYNAYVPPQRLSSGPAPPGCARHRSVHAGGTILLLERNSTIGSVATWTAYSSSSPS
jgi:hypothetical protein